MRKSEPEKLDERETSVCKPLLVIGAGPYGLATAAYARRNGIEPVVLGEPMAFWRESMLIGILLRWGAEWHLDAAKEHTLEAYLKERGINPADISPTPGPTIYRVRGVVSRKGRRRGAAGSSPRSPQLRWALRSDAGKRQTHQCRYRRCSEHTPFTVIPQGVEYPAPREGVRWIRVSSQQDSNERLIMAPELRH